eukprot:NODE_70_length_2800_cov_54.990185_g44_i0.p1 GENE.NODE_70_length_2800_cov_54.990185_g44_i0~~NODE_70_length_2800_cov_54.990185_g44_i0.p1  ORF type:complete len:869 (+),score=259.39 NODE_70_length_2800_cov_54.990185_g44_i0:66-2609(+)
MSNTGVVRLQPYKYMHVLDNNKNVSHIVLGPKTFTRQEHEEIIQKPQDCISVPPRSYCIIANPVVRDAAGNAVEDEHGQAKVRLGDREIRFAGPPFPLYPQEALVAPGVQKMEVVAADCAVKLRALRDFEFVDAAGGKQKKVAGDLYLFHGPGTLIPRVEEERVAQVKATVVAPGEALRVRATYDYTDRDGVIRKAGEEWLISKVGAFLPSVEEEIVQQTQPIILTEQVALHLDAVRNFTDSTGVKRLAGEQWLLTSDRTTSYLPSPNEKIARIVNITILTKPKYCVVLNACDQNGKCQLGSREVRRGPCTFFLQPGEQLEAGIQEVYTLGEHEAVLLLAMDPHMDGKEDRKPGDKWMVYGPAIYCPSAHVSVLEKRQKIPLATDEGIYVRNVLSGKVKTEMGKTYMLRPEEELWEKDVPSIVEDKLACQGAAHTEYIEGSGGKKGKRDKTRVVAYNLPHNAICQVYDFKERASRVIFGPDRVYLAPDEEFTVLSLSGSEWVPNKPTEVSPKKEGMIKALFLFLGPDTMSDVMEVETADHARLKLQLSYSWHFDVKHGDIEGAKKVFNVPDFVMDACKRVASRVRGAVAAEPFDIFHRNSAKIISSAVFGMDDGDDVRNCLVFPSNNLVISSIDIQNVECTDAKTRDSLQKSVKLAIEITTSAQEAMARHIAEEKEQKAKGELEKQLLGDSAAAEKERKYLLEMEAESRAIESTGASKAEAKAVAESRIIEGQSAVNIAKLKAQAKAITYVTELENLTEKRNAEISYIKAMDQLEIDREDGLSKIEVNKFSSAVQSIGPSTIAAMARAGPEMQAKLLKGLGLEGYMLTDGNSPINLFNAANSLVGAA